MSLKVFTTFSGYDSQCMALDRAGIDYELVGWSEIDKFAIQAHNAVYPEYAERNYGDITKIDWNAVPDFDFLTYSSPCQDFSNAGLQKGGEKGSGTRSSLLWECERCIVAKRPKYLMMENVAALVSKKFIALFHQWLHTLESYGYTNYAKVLNAKDYGVPQNRQRIFIISKLDDSPFYFPDPIKLDKSIKDILEKSIGQCYYLSQNQIKMFLRRNKINEQRGNGFRFEPVDINGVAKSITTNSTRDCNTYISDDDNDKGLLEFDEVNEVLKIRQNTAKGYTEVGEGGAFDLSYPNSTTRRGRVQEGGNVSPALTSLASAINVFEKSEPKIIKAGTISPTNDFHDPKEKRIYSVNGIAPTLDTMRGGGRETKILEKVVQTPRIRKLTPRECFRLMGVCESDIDKIQNADISNSQQYKLAGNSIVVDVMAYMFDNLFNNKQLKTTLF